MKERGTGIGREGLYERLGRGMMYLSGIVMAGGSGRKKKKGLAI